MTSVAKRIRDYDVATRYHATLVTTRRITDDDAEDEVRELTLDVDRLDFPYQIGQSIAVFAPAPDVFGNEHHIRLYSVADLPTCGDDGQPRIKICVRRCGYVDEYSGEYYRGVASNYLCDLKPGDRLTLAGPFGLAFEIPEEKSANVILIGTGTGIAPFRAFVKHLFHNVPGFTGRVWLFYGGRTGLELLYMNERLDDFAQYYDQETFVAFKALSPRPHWADPIAWDQAIAERGEELWAMLADPKTYVYVAGLENMRDELDAVFANLAGSTLKWQRRKAELAAGKRWVELLY